MSDINLLPEDLRREEERELLKRKGQKISLPQYHSPVVQKPGESKVPVAVNNKTQSVFKKRDFSPNNHSANNNLVKDIEQASQGPSPFRDYAQKQKFPESAGPLSSPQNQSRQGKKSLFSKLFKKKKERKLIKLEKIGEEKIAPAAKKPAPAEAKAQPEPKSAPRAAGAAEPQSTIFGRSIDVNLLPEGAGLLSIKRLLFYFGLAALAGAVLLGAIYFGLVFYNQNLESQFEQIDDQIALLEKDLDEFKGKEQEALIWSNRVEAARLLLERHIYWSKFFPELEKVTLPDIYYKNIGASSDGRVSLTAEAPDFTTLAKQYIVLENNKDIFPEMQISGIMGSGLGVGFNISLKLAPGIYYSLDKE
ncbi:hypothetical protein KJ840_03150 [Patescibacteria group bacterium]|nr:hypothetical protein [Patescibacteria group bacterium]